VVLRHPWSVTLLVLVGFTFAAGPSRDVRLAGAALRLPTAAVCNVSFPERWDLPPQRAISGAEPDVLEPTDLSDVDYAVSVTPDGGAQGSATWGANTNGHTATFTVRNTGLCNDTFSFSATGTGGITGISLNKTSAALGAGASTTVIVTYNVTTPGSATLTLGATGSIGGEGDNGFFNVTVISYGVAVTPDAQPITVAAGTAQAVRLQVRNTGSASNTYTLSCSVTGSETCGTVVPTSLTLAAGALDSATVNFTAGATGTSGTVTLTASGGGPTSDIGSFSVTNATFSVAVTPDARPRSVNGGASQTVTFQVRNTGTVNDTYALTCVVAGSETCGPVSPPTLTNIIPGISNPVTVTFTAGSAGTSGTVTLHAARTGSFGTASDDGSYSVTNAAPLVAVTPDGQALTLAANSTSLVTFQIANVGSASEVYALTCAATGNTACGAVSPPQITVGPGAAGPVTVSATTSGPGTGTLTLHAAGSRGGSDDGRYIVSISAPPPSYGVDVTPDGTSLPVRFGTGQSLAFVVTNTGSATNTFNLACADGGEETCNALNAVSPSQVTLAPGAATGVLVNFGTGASGQTGSITLIATGAGGATDLGLYQLTNGFAPPEQCPQAPQMMGPEGAEPDVIELPPHAAAAICHAVTVNALSGGASWTGNTTDHVALFRVSNVGSSLDDYDFTCVATPPVTCVSLTPPAANLYGAAATTVAVKYGVGASGAGTLKLRAVFNDNPAVKDSASISVTASAVTYGVAVTPDVQSRSVDVNSAQAATFRVRSTGTGGETYTLTCATTGLETCGSVSPSPLTLAPGDSAAVTVNFTALGVGSGTVTLQAAGSGGSSGNGSYNIKNTYFVAVSPDGRAVSRLAARAYSDSFTIRNPGINQATYTLSATCSGTAIASGCTPSIASLTLADGDSGKVAVSYTTGATGTTGQVKLMATATLDATAKDSGWTSVTVGTAQAPTVDVASVNPGTTRERGLCLTFAAGDGAATECGDLRIVHPLPATRTLNKLRVPTLLYNSAEARPYPLVAANVTLPAGAATPDTVIATLKIGSVTRGIAKWLGTDWVPGSTRRVVVADTVAGDSTKLYSYTLTVTNQWNGASVLTSPAATLQAPVVSRKQSAFGAGWWLAGVERLYTDSMLWVGGDGSTRRYTAAGTNVWGAPNVDRPDTLKKNPTLNQYTRYLPHGVRVVFDAQGRHIFTIGRLSDTTRFTWGAGDTLLTITMPPAGLTYQFVYTNGTRWVVTAPSVPGQTRADTGMISGGRLTTIRGPDTTRVTFGYGSGTDANLMVSRTDRRANATTFGFDGGKRLLQSVRPDIGTTRWQALETVGYPAGDAAHATDTALAYARYDGPRSDVWDTTAFWLDRLGAPRKIVNALGYQTLITRGDARWPALATQVQGPTGLITQATYDTRGNVLTTTQVNPLGDGRNAVTTYIWDMVWDFATSVTMPQGEVSQTAYDPATGNRLWQQPGTDPARRVQFFYTNDAFHQLRAIQYPTSPVTRDSVFYDATLRNVDTTKTPLGFVTAFFKDAIGRDTLTKTIDVAVVSARVVYDVAGQDTLNVTSPNDASGTLTVRKHYDAGGNQDSVQTLSSPDPAAIQWMRHVFTYDRANRKITERLVGPATTTIAFAYDPAGNLINGGRQGGSNVAVTYDALNRPVRRAQVNGDTAVFTYDTLGNILTANNANARITRTYYRNGALQADTLRLATDFLPARDFSQHKYVQEFRYDLDGRRVWAKHPTQLSPGTDTVAYSYDPVFGQLASASDPLGNRYGLSFDSLGRPRRITRYPVGLDSVYEALSYDGDGRLSTRSVQTSTTTLITETLQYFGGGARVQSAAHGYPNDVPSTDQFTYTGFGALTSTVVPTGPETYRVDPLANRTYADHGSGIQPDNYSYAAATGWLSFKEEIRHAGPRDTGKDTTFYSYAGNGRLDLTEHRHYWTATFCQPLPVGCQPSNSAGVERLTTTNFYDPEERLARTEFRQDSQPPFRSNYAPYVSTEQYRYDALGRRVYTRVVRGVDCLHHDQGSGCKSLLTRTVWDGDQVLYEIRVHGDTGASDLESDAPAADSTHGVVGYLHTGGIDRPLALWKSGEPLVLPFANYRGAFITGTCPVASCNAAFFPQGLASSFGDPPVFHYGPPFWHGSILDGGLDGSGYQYKRNRYYDPNSGRFTQEDPIGLAGGLNLYGFAGGDPVNFSDPFGLCPPKDTFNGPWCRVGFVGVSLNLIAGAGLTFGAGHYISNEGEGWYLRVGIGSGLDVSLGGEAGESDNMGAFSEDGEAMCGGAGPVNGCKGSNKSGGTVSVGPAVGPTETVASGHGEKSYTFVTKPKFAKPAPPDTFDCSKPHPSNHVCNR